MFTAAPTSFIGVMLAAFATFSYGAGYFRDEVWGRRAFGIPLMICGFSGDALIAFHHPLWGQPLLVAAGIIAGARSITAFFKGTETRQRPDAPDEELKWPAAACKLPKP